MPRKIVIDVNPYLEQTRCEFGGNFFAGDGRLSQWVEGRPMSEWLPASRMGYQRWEGFLPELMRALNEDELDLCFRGLPSDQALFCQTLRLQEADTVRMGFEPDRYTVRCEDKFLPEPLRAELRQVRELARRRVVMVPPTQELVGRMDKLDGMLFADGAADVAALRELYRGYVDTYAACAERSQVQDTWRQQLNLLEQVFS